MNLQRSLAVATCLVLSGLAAKADPVADFYKGKTVEIVIGYSTGGGYDSYARLLAKYIGKYIPGNPEVIARNMPGAGSLVATNYIANLAPRDGTAFAAVSRGIPVLPLLGNQPTQFEALKLNWIGSLTSETSICASWHTSDIKSWNDVIDGKHEFVVGGTGATSDVEVFTNLIKTMFNANMKLISGYPGAAELNLAIESGEVEGRCGWSWSSISGQHPDWIRDKKINLLAQLATKKAADLPDVPVIVDLAQTEDQKKLLQLVFSRLELARPYVAPPEVPAERIEALRTAFMATAADPDFLAEAKKAKMEINPTSGEEATRLIAAVYASDPKTIAKAKELLAGLE